MLKFEDISTCDYGIIYSVSIPVLDDTEYSASLFCYGPMQIISPIISFHASMSYRYNPVTCHVLCDHFL